VMALYCLCGESNGEIVSSDDPVAVWLSRQMECVKTGSSQYIKTFKVGEEPRYSKHYPNVDLFRCRVCGAYIAKEG